MLPFIHPTHPNTINIYDGYMHHCDVRISMTDAFDCMCYKWLVVLYTNHSNLHCAYTSMSNMYRTPVQHQSQPPTRTSPQRLITPSTTVNPTTSTTTTINNISLFPTSSTQQQQHQSTQLHINSLLSDTNEITHIPCTLYKTYECNQSLNNLLTHMKQVCNAECEAQAWKHQ